MARPEPGSRRFKPVIYLEGMPHAWRVHRPDCPIPDCCGFVVPEPDSRGDNDLWTCTGGCGQRWGTDFK